MIMLVAIASALICLFVLAIVIRSLTVLLHELGHAIPAILLTKARVTVYLGSYGDNRKCVQLRMGLLNIWMKYIPFWNKGVCIPSELNITINKKIIYTLAGPIMSLSISVIAFACIYFFELNLALKLALILFIASSLIDFIHNITPKSSLIKLHNGESVYNDGYQLKQLFYLKGFSKKLEEAILLLNDKDYPRAAIKFSHFLSLGLKGEDLYRLTIFAFIQAKEYESAISTHNLLELNYGLNADDYANLGLIKARMNLQTESLAEYENALSLNPDNHIALNNKGYHLNLLKRYTEAILIFDKAILLDPAFAYSYNNRGLSKIKIGQVDEGLKDIEYSLQLDPENAYAFKNLGIYHLDKNEAGQALIYFQKAKKLDADTQGIDEVIEEASQWKK